MRCLVLTQHLLARWAGLFGSKMVANERYKATKRDGPVAQPDRAAVS
jgi:hypothetical protein